MVLILREIPGLYRFCATYLCDIHPIYFCCDTSQDGIMVWQRFLHYWPFVRGNHGLSIDSPHYWPVFVLPVWTGNWTIRKITSHLLCHVTSRQWFLKSHISNAVPASRPTTRSGAAADRRTVLKWSAQVDLATSYAVPRTGRTESPTSLNYAKVCVELNYFGAAIGEMWGDLAIRHIVFE